MSKVTVEELSERHVVQIDGVVVANFETFEEAREAKFAIEDALSIENEEGYSKGNADGYDMGYDEGHEVGYSEGYDVGVTDGSTG